MAVRRMQGYLSLIEDWTKANNKSVITAIIGVLITPVLVAWLVNWSGLSPEVPQTCKSSTFPITHLPTKMAHISMS